MSKDILSLISSKMNTFSKGQKLIANYILSSYDKAAFMTASKLGKTVHVSESTVVRFASELKYDGYPAMQKALQEMIRNKLTSIQRIEVSNDIIGNADVVSSVMQSDMEKIRMTMEEIDRDSFQAAVNAIVNAKKIYILGTRSSGSLAGFLSFYFGLMFDNVVHVGESANQEIFDQIVQVGEGDVTIGLSFPRYSRRTVRAINFAHERGSKVIAITDNASNAMAKAADYVLLAKSDMASFVDSLVAPLSLINALLVAIARSKSDVVEHFGWSISGTSTAYSSVWRKRTNDKHPRGGHRRRGGRDDGRPGGPADGGPGDPGGVQREAGPQAVHHRQGPVQPDQQHHAPGGAGPRASERTVPVQRGDPVPPGGGDGIL